MPEATQEPQDGARQAKSPVKDMNRNPKGSSILGRLRAGEKVPGYYIDDKNKLRKEGYQAPMRQEGDFDRLKAMRHVLTNPPTTDQSEGEKACRAWLEKSPGPFMETYDRLEAEAKKAERGKDAEDEEEALEPEDSDEELAEQINELLAKHQPKRK